MKPSILQGFVREWLAVRGLEPEVVDQDVWRVPVPRPLQERFGRKALVLCFTQRGMARHPEGELATVGNPVFDRLLAVAREEGRIGIGYTKPPSPAARPPKPEKLPVIDGVTAGTPEPVYQAIYHLAYTITYPTIEQADEIEVVSIDGGTLELLAQTPDLTDLWKSLEPGPRKGRALLPAVPIPEPLLDGGQRALERRMRRRIKKVEQSNEDRLRQESTSIEAYYQQLIEETRHQSKRWTTRQEEREERIRWLQLEWRRRIEEAHEFWKPRVNARLAAVGVQMVPRVAYYYAPPRPRARNGKAGARTAGPALLWDEATRALLTPCCVRCGRTGLAEPRIGPAGFLCGDCAGKPELRLVPAEEPGRRSVARS